MSQELVSCQDINREIQDSLKGGPLYLEVSLQEFALARWMRACELRAQNGQHILLLEGAAADELSERGQREIRGWIVGALLRSGYLYTTP